MTGVHPRAGFTTGDYEEAGIKRALTARAAETVVMASREKLNAASAFAIGELSLASTLIVDGEPDRRAAPTVGAERRGDRPRSAVAPPWRRA